MHYCADSPYGPFWSVTRYDDIMKVELDHATYSSAAHLGGIALRDNPFGQDMANFISMDPPGHTGQRRTVAPIMAPKNLRNMEETIRQRTGDILNSLPRGESFDWVDKVSVELTTMMLATLFDFPWEDRRLLTYWSDVATTDYGAPGALVHSDDERLDVLKEMGQYIGRLWKERGQNDGGFDLISMLSRAEATKDMNHMDLIANSILLIVGGNDTTRNTMTGSVYGLHKFPENFEKLKADPSLIEKFVPEVIRWQTPLSYMRRTATRDCELRGRPIRKHDQLLMWYVSANRDEDVFEDPFTFNIERKPNPHVAFGYGEHFCMGAHFARRSMAAILNQLVTRIDSWELVGDPEWIKASFVVGLKHLPVRYQLAG